MENVMIFDHPLIQHKISKLRDKNTGTNEFRSLIEEIAMLMGYEALRDLPLENVQVETPDVYKRQVWFLLFLLRSSRFFRIRFRLSCRSAFFRC